MSEEAYKSKELLIALSSSKLVLVFLCNLISGKILLMLISTLLHVCDDVIVVAVVVESGKRGGGGAI